jgi:hypothetical protein
MLQIDERRSTGMGNSIPNSQTNRAAAPKGENGLSPPSSQLHSAHLNRQDHPILKAATEIGSGLDLENINSVCPMVTGMGAVSRIGCYRIGSPDEHY